MTTDAVLQFARQFFMRMGIEANVERDYLGVLVTIPVVDYQHRQIAIDPWFTAVKETPETVILRERERGTGQTR